MPGLFCYLCPRSLIEDFVDCGKFFCNAEGSDPHFYGLVPTGTPTCDADGCAYGLGQQDIIGNPEPVSAGIAGCPLPGTPLASPRACSTTSTDVGGSTLAHELAHNYGRGHATRTIGTFGFDFATKTVIQPNILDFMDPGDPGDVWISPNNYRALLSHFKSSSTSACPRGSKVFPLLLSQSNQTERLLVSGHIVSDKVVLRPMYRMMRPGIPDPPSDGRYSIELIDEPNKETLFKWNFEPTPMADSNSEIGSFRAYLPWHEGTTHIVFKRFVGTTVDSVILSKVAVSPNTPSVNLSNPIPGSLLNGTVPVRWTATDADGDSLTARIEYSTDGGQGWTPVAVSIRESQFDLDTSTLPGSNAVFLRVHVSDGVNTAVSQLGPFTVPNKAPSAFILSQESQIEIEEGTSLTLQGLATDAEDGSLAGGNLFWESDAAGLLEIGPVLQTTKLPPGEHTITFKAIDSDGNVGTDSISLLVLATPPPEENFVLNVKAMTESGMTLKSGIKIFAPSRFIDFATPLTAAFEQGAQVRIEAVPEILLNGITFSFKHWQLTNSSTLREPTISLTIDKGEELVAVYQVGFQIVCPNDINSVVDIGTRVKVISYDPPLVENSLGNKTVICMPPSGSIFPLGTTTVTCTATDRSNLSAQCSFSVMLDPVKVLCPQDIKTAITNPGGSSATVVYPLPGLNVMIPDANVICLPPSGSSFQVGVNVVHCNATSTAGDIAGCAFAIVVFERSNVMRVKD